MSTTPRLADPVRSTPNSPSKSPTVKPPPSRRPTLSFIPSSSPSTTISALIVDQAAVPVPPRTPTDPIDALKLANAQGSKPFFMPSSNAHTQASAPPPVPGDDVDPPPTASLTGSPPVKRRTSDPIGSPVKERQASVEQPKWLYEPRPGGTSAKMGSLALAPDASPFEPSSAASFRTAPGNGDDSSFDASFGSGGQRGPMIVHDTPELSFSTTASSPEASFGSNSSPLASFHGASFHSPSIFASGVKASPMVSALHDSLHKSLSMENRHPSEVDYESPTRAMATHFGEEAFYSKSNTTRPAQARTAFDGPLTATSIPTTSLSPAGVLAFSPATSASSTAASAGTTPAPPLGSSPLALRGRASTIPAHAPAVAPFIPASATATIAKAPLLPPAVIRSSPIAYTSSVPSFPDHPHSAPDPVAEELRTLVGALVGRVDVLERTAAKHERELAVWRFHASYSGVGGGTSPPHRLSQVGYPSAPSTVTANGVPPAQQTGYLQQQPRSGLQEVRYGSGLPGVDYVDYTAANAHPDPLAVAGYSAAPMLQSVPLARSVSMQGTMSVPVRSASGLPTGQVVNYRSLMADDVDCDYTHFVDRIVRNSDQQASIFLQHKIKQTAPLEYEAGEMQQRSARAEITRLVIANALDLMTNRFGNFLVSRVIEYATPRERVLLAETIRGHIVALACDTFATHCLQNMVEHDVPNPWPPSSSSIHTGFADHERARPGAVRLLIASELLMKHESVTHRSAGHVWARLLASAAKTDEADGMVNPGDDGPAALGSSAELARALDAMLRGRWAKTAKDEVGSLIVQSVLENWTDLQKAGVVEELLDDLKACALQQWGNFVVLYLIEHSSPAIRVRLFARLFQPQLACELSGDNYGAKAMEKAIKTAGLNGREVEEYVKAICEFGHGRPASVHSVLSRQHGGPADFARSRTGQNHRHRLPHCRRSSINATFHVRAEYPQGANDPVCSPSRRHSEVVEGGVQDLVPCRADESLGRSLICALRPSQRFSICVARKSFVTSASSAFCISDFRASISRRSRARNSSILLIPAAALQYFAIASYRPSSCRIRNPEDHVPSHLSLLLPLSRIRNRVSKLRALPN